MTTFAQLKSDIADYMARGDLTSVIPSFVRLAESRIRDKVRVQDMETTTDLAISSQSTALPSGFLGLRRLIMDSSTHRKMEYLPPDTVWRDLGYVDGGNPEAYTIEGNNLIVFPAPGSTINAKVTYFKAYDALTADSDTNWLLTNAYDVYLFASLAEAKTYIEDDEQALKYINQFDSACERINKTALRSRQGVVLSRSNHAP